MRDTSGSSDATRVWLFDLDNTLHDASPHIFPHINRSMTEYLMRHLALDEAGANALRIEYWHRYGATLLGLMRNHGTDAAHFLHETHQFPQLERMLVFNRALAARLRHLPGRKVLFSNAPEAYARAVLRGIGLERCFERVFGIEQLGLQPKPQSESFRRVLHALRLPAHRCIMVEDTLPNLRAAKALGMRTVWVNRGSVRPACVDVKLRNILDLRSAAHLVR
ncbi:pyrimidine 5'-nucleotidase [Niveibacterium umoris]|uniref:Putative hydrolase of the HAD superfamily n=2 Tax=Niveibacterium umoris TaxID=1193620 RepID=A0A840BLV1_9RHOO|nr:pyrimidine 5'-nucleotidase [Niveibacterium umoris]MBB4012538.1 putative hydrolase of the HAD superfamily [Niveibacterium umoris]